MTELEENKDESKEKFHFLNKDETLFEITDDGNSLFHCLAHHNMKEEISIENIKLTVGKQLKEY
jgi:hypothetical protein